MARRRRRFQGQDEPLAAEEGWVSWGGKPMWAVGETPGGAPYGLTREEFRMALERDDRRAGWARAAKILTRAIHARVDPRTTVETGRVRKVGAGLSRDLFAAEVEVAPDPQNLSGVYVVLLPRQDAVPGLDARTGREVVVLKRLAGIPVPFRVPRVIGVVSESDRLVLVREFLPGIPLDLRAGPQLGVPPWELVGRLAAAIHRIDLSNFCDILPGYATQHDHGHAGLEVFNGLEGSQVQDAYAWARAHLPAEAPSVFLHGDLLGQNILLCPEALPAVIDWEYAMRGHPAYDLAIVTRGTRRPFQVERGLERLLEAYEVAGGTPLTATDVRFHEVCLAAGWYREALAGKGVEPPDQARQRLLGILKRAQAARS